MINYKELYERIQKGERDIDVAVSAGITVNTLYANLVDKGFMSSNKRVTEEVWKQQYEAFNAGKSVTEIAEDLNVQRATVYNHFYSFGLKSKERTVIDKEQLLFDYQNGMRIDELSRKYKCTATHVRFLLRPFKNIAKKDI